MSNNRWFTELQDKAHSANRFSVFRALPEETRLPETKRLSSTTRVSKLNEKQQMRTYEQVKAEQRYVVPGTETTDPERADSKPNIPLAAGYIEYYRRQGLLSTSFAEALQSSRNYRGRNPTLRQLCQNSISSMENAQPANFPEQATPGRPNWSSQAQQLTDSRQSSRRSVPSDSSRTGSVRDAKAITSADLHSHVKSGLHETESEKVSSSHSAGSPPSVFETDVEHDRYEEPFQISNSQSEVSRMFYLSVPTEQPTGMVNVSAPTGQESESCTQVTSHLQIPNNCSHTSQPIEHVQVCARPVFCLFTASSQKKSTELNSHGDLLHLRTSDNDLAHLTRRPNKPLSATNLGPRATTSETDNSPVETRSWINLNDTIGVLNESYSYTSADSSGIRPNPAINLPDVYLNPPSLTSLQSKPKSPYRENRTLLTSHSYCSVFECESDTKPTDTSALNQPGYNRMKAEFCQSNVLRFEEKDPDGFGLQPTDFRHPVKHESSYFGLVEAAPSGRRNHQELGASFNLCKDKPPSTGFNSLKRALSLTLRSKEPKSLGAELQSIMDKHYELTGIRMLTANQPQPTQNGLCDGLTQLKAATAKLWNRRRSFSVDKPELSTTSFPTSGSVLRPSFSTLNLDCFQLSSDKTRKPPKEQKSVLASLTAVAIPCLGPLRSRLHSDTCAIEQSTTKRLTDKKIPGDQERRTSNLNASLTDIHWKHTNPMELSKCLMGIHTPIRAVKSSANLERLK